MEIHLHSKQTCFYESRAKYTLFCGGIGSGKTFTGATRFLLRSLRWPRSNGYILANTYDQLREATLSEFQRVAAQAGVCTELVWSTREIRLPGGSRAHFHSLERFNDLRGIEVGHFWIDEARDVREEAWEVLRGRLRQKGAPLAGDLTTTPNGLSHWLYRHFEAQGLPNTASVHAATSDNLRNLPEGYLEDLAHSYEGGWYEQEILGLFTNVTRGRCYRNFERDKHVGGPLAFDPQGDLLVGVDFNVDPMSAVLAQECAGGLHVIGEFYERDSDTFELCEWLEKYWRPRLSVERRIICYPDASGAARSTTGTSDAEILRNRFEVRAPPGNPSHSDRTNAVNRFFRSDRIRIDPICRHLIASLEQTVWEEGSRRIDKRAGVEHLSDALGYLICTRYPLRRPTRVRMRRM